MSLLWHSQGEQPCSFVVFCPVLLYCRKLGLVNVLLFVAFLSPRVIFEEIDSFVCCFGLGVHFALVYCPNFIFL